MAKRRRKLPNFLRPPEIDTLLAAARARIDAARTPGKRRAAERDVVMVQTMLNLGLRVSEACALKVEDLDLSGAVCRVVEGKGCKDREVPINPRLLAVLREWIGDRTAGWVLAGPGGRKLASRTAQTRTATLGRAAGLARRLKCHTLRHSFAMSLKRAGADLYDIKELMGHESLATTQVYLHLDSESLRKAVDRL